MGEGKTEERTVAASAPALSRWVRVGLMGAGGGLVVVGAVALLSLKLDGVGVTAFVFSGAVLTALGILGRLPAQLKLRDVEVAWQLQREEKNAIQLAATRPEVDDPTLIEKAAIVEQTVDLTAPLFEDRPRLAELASISPKAALLATYGELEEQVRGLAHDVGLLPEVRRIERIADIAARLVRENWLTGWHASAILSLSNARNAVAHSPNDVPDIEVTALLGLTVQIAGEVKIRRQAAIAGYTPVAGDGPAASR